MTLPVGIDSICAARERVAGIARLTPIVSSETFNQLCGREIYFKLENLQKTGSFKVRGASNKIQLLDEGERARGVVTASAGNHAQGVAYAAKRAGVPVTVVMPETAAFSKISATAGYGAQVVQGGRDYAEAYAQASDIARETGATFIHAFDDADVIAGQGTLGLELIDQLASVDTVVVPVGGGGLIAGIIVALRGSGSRARIIGVQASAASALRPSLQKGACIELERVDTIADGLATRRIGALPFEIIRGELDDAVTVTDAEIADAILLLLERSKTVVEGAGAAGLAACLAGRIPAGSRKVAVVITGGNIDSNLLDRIINLGLAEEGRLFRFTIWLSDRPGELQRLVTAIAACRANIHQVHHERAQPGLAPTQVSVILDVETRGHEHVEEIKRAVEAAGFRLVA